MQRTIALGFCVLWASHTLLSSPSEHLHRALLTKRHFEIVTPESEPRIVGIDPETNEPITYDPQSRVEVLDADAGQYNLIWIGLDGQAHTIVYQRPDALDVAVFARATQLPDKRFRYEYTISNMVWSGQHLSGFVIQTFSPDVEGERTTAIFPGFMASSIPEFSVGRWLRFGILRDSGLRVDPGESITFALFSEARPRLIQCAAHGGQLGMKGVGAEMPFELESQLLGYEAWLRGYTIGPSQQVPTRQQIWEELEIAVQQGWLSQTLLPWYRDRFVSPGDLKELLVEIDAHIQAGDAAPEVRALALGLGVNQD